MTELSIAVAIGIPSNKSPSERRDIKITPLMVSRYSEPLSQRLQIIDEGTTPEKDLLEANRTRPCKAHRTDFQANRLGTLIAGFGAVA